MVRRGGEEDRRGRGPGGVAGAGLIAYNHVKLLLWQPFYNAKKKRQFRRHLQSEEIEARLPEFCETLFATILFKSSWHKVSANKHMKLHVWLLSHAALWSRLAFIWEIHSLIDKTKAGRPPSRSSKDVSQRIPATQITDTDSTILMLPAEMSKAFLTAAPFFHMHIDNLLIFLPN